MNAEPGGDRDGIARELGVVAVALLQLSERVGTETGQAAASLRAAARDTATVSQRLLTQSVEQAGRAAAAAIAEAVRDPARRMEAVLDGNTARLDQTARRLEARLATSRRLHTGHSWIALAASALVVALALAAALYAAHLVQSDLVQVRWTDDINAAVATGHLARCPDGHGVCALLDGHWTRLSP